MATKLHYISYVATLDHKFWFAIRYGSRPYTMHA